MVIFDATIKDLDALYEFRKKLKKEDKLSELRPKRWYKANLEAYKGKKDKRFLIVKDKDKVIGQMLIKFNKELEGFLNYIAIDVDYHGTGIAKTLLETGLIFLKKNRVKFVRLYVLRENAKAIAFYKKFGFKYFGPYRDGHEADEYILEFKY